MDSAANEDGGPTPRDPDVEPSVTLASDEPSQADFSSVVLSRLAGQSPASNRYQVEGEVARGGMGAVLRVWDESLRRRLAMKVMLGQAAASEHGDTPAVDPRTLARFFEEAQVTGQLDHPGIVPVHELGLDAEGRIFFTMKLVKGKTLRQVFDELARGEGGWTQTRVLGLIQKVCDAMSYAHAKGVIHRDLKPANVMVGKFGEVYVMDWGLARVTGRDDERDIRPRAEPVLLTSEVRSERRDRTGSTPDMSLMTMDGDVVGTPAYMPPEQARGDLPAMGPQSDVYAVGAMLYHLLTGQMPYVPRGARLNNYAVWQRVQEGPPRPLGEVAAGVPAELAAICERAMARESAARYADMSELAMDLRAYLEHRVVAAYRTGAVAELRKWVERNKPLAAALAVAVAILLGGLGASLVLRAQAEREADKANTIRDFLMAILSEGDVLSHLYGSPGRAPLSGEVTLAEALRTADGQFGRLADDPESEGALRKLLGDVYFELGFFADALPHLDRALELQRELHGPGDERTLRTMLVLALTERWYRRSERALLLSREALNTAVTELGDDHELTHQARIVLGWTLSWYGQSAEAIDVVNAGIALAESDLAITYRAVLSVAMLFSSSVPDSEKEELALRTIAAARDHAGPDSFPEGVVALALAENYHGQGRYDEAVRYRRQALRIYELRFGPGHVWTLMTAGAFAQDLRKSGRWTESEALARRAVEGLYNRNMDDHPSLANAIGTHAIILHEMGSHEKAAAVLRELENPLRLGQVAWRFVRPDRGVRGLEGRGLELARLATAGAPDDPECRKNLAWALFANDRHDEAMAESERALELAPLDQEETFRGHLERMRNMLAKTHELEHD